MAMVHLENVRVDFPIYGAQRSLGRALLQKATGGVIQREGRNGARIVVHALSDISLRLEDGDRLGLVGHNGSGKSTLLKVLAGIYEPISGWMTVDGRVTPLLEMMPGLDLGDTGYQNIVTGGLLLGLSRAQIAEKIPEIEEFCELGEYLTLPVRTYSAGMKMRLGFSLATALHPDILLMDEGFGAADLRFTERATKRMNDFIGRSSIMVLASHSEGVIRSLCNKAVLMQEGRVVALGSVDDICDQYRDIVRSATRSVAATPGPPAEKRDYSEQTIRDVAIADRLARTSGAVRLTKAIARDEDGQTKWTFRRGDTATFRFEYEVITPVANLGLYFRLYLPSNNSGGQEIIADLFEVLSAEPLGAGEVGAIDLDLNLKFMPRDYFLYVALGNSACLANPGGSVFYDTIDANVALPPLRIDDAGEKSNLRGSVPLDYEVRKISAEKLPGGEPADRRFIDAS